VNGIPTGTPAIQIGGGGGYWDSSLLQPSTAHQVFGRFDYEATDNIPAYVQFAGNFKTDTNYAEYIQLNNVTFSSSNPFLAPQYQQILANANQPTFRLSELIGSGPRNAAQSESDQWMIFAGLEGDAGIFNWTLHYTHGRSELNTTLRNNRNNQRLAYALDAVQSGNQVVCPVIVTNPGLADDCIPLNVFGPTAATDVALDYVTGDVFLNVITVMDDVTASVVGSPFSTWAGPVDFALSGEYRTLSFTANSTSPLNDTVDCTGIRYNCTPGTVLWEGVFFDSPKISEEVYEAALETNVPLIEDMLNVNGAVRYTNYKNSGSYWTWKIGADLSVSDTLRFRATRSRDIRAPTLYDLFAPGNGSTISPTDLLTGLTPIVRGFNGSNPDLGVEIGNTLTGGVVWTPLPELSVALDAYHITISDAIVTVQGWNEARTATATPLRPMR